MAEVDEPKKAISLEASHLSRRKHNRQFAIESNNIEKKSKHEGVA